MRSIGLSVGLLGFACSVHAQYTRLTDLPAYYDVQTGNLTIDVTNIEGETLTSYNFNAFGAGGFRPDNHTPIMNTFFVNATEDAISENNFDGIAAGVYSLGEILPIGLSEEQLRDTYFHGTNGGIQDRYVNYYAIGALGGGEYHVFRPIYSPSPFPTLNDPTVGLGTIERWAEVVLLTYNATNGGLTIDSTGERGGTFWTYEISLTAPEFNVDAFQPVSSLPPALREDYITEVSFTGISEGVYYLGPVLPSGMTVDEVEVLLDQVRFIGEPGHWSDSLDVEISGVEMAFAFLPETGIESPADFDGDGGLDVDDIDALVAEIVIGDNDGLFDLTGDGILNGQDLEQWLASAAEENGFSAPYLLGDTDLDGSVDAGDLNALGRNWLEHPNAWQHGDLTADGTVDASDLNQLARNWHSSIPMAATSVPEPSSYMALICLALISFSRRPTKTTDRRI